MTTEATMSTGSKAMNDERTASIAYAALSNLSKRVFRTIAEKVAAAGPGGIAIISRRSFADAGFHSATLTTCALRELVALGMIERGFAAHRAATFRLSERWKSFEDADAAKALAATARAPRHNPEGARRAVKRETKKSREQVRHINRAPVEPEPPPARKISIYQLPWPSPRGLELLRGDDA